MPNNAEDEITINGVTISRKKADNILKWLIAREAQNVRTKAYTDMQMINEIQKRIREEAECY